MQQRPWPSEHHEIMADFRYYDRIHRLQWASESMYWALICELTRRCEYQICSKFRKDIDEVYSFYRWRFRWGSEEVLRRWYGDGNERLLRGVEK